MIMVPQGRYVIDLGQAVSSHPIVEGWVTTHCKCLFLCVEFLDFIRFMALLSTPACRQHAQVYLL